MDRPTGKCIIFSAPSGAGKTTIVRHLLREFDSLAFSISATSRLPRGDEKDGDHYHFLSADEFREAIEADEFLEWEEVYPDQYYGTLKKEIERIWSQGKHVIFDVDVVGGVNLKRIFGPDALAVFVKPPSMDILEERLRGRSTESEAKLLQRLSKARHEMDYLDKFDVVIVNDILEETCAKACQIVKNFLSN